jgi:hypothetical protein
LSVKSPPGLKPKGPSGLGAEGFIQNHCLDKDKIYII